MPLKTEDKNGWKERNKVQYLDKVYTGEGASRKTCLEIVNCCV